MRQRNIMAGNGKTMRSAKSTTITGWLLAFYCCMIEPVAAQPAESVALEPHAAAIRFGGYLDVRQAHWTFNREAADYQTAYAGAPQRETLDRTRSILKLNATMGRGEWRISGRAHAELRDDQFASENEHRFDELFAAWTPSPRSAIRAGKIVLNWGRGYIWNPASFVERPKDPTDPRTAREGYTMLTADISREWANGAEITFSPVLLPVTQAINATFGEQDRLNVAGRLLLSHGQGEIAYQFLAAGSRSARHGYTFALSVAPGLNLYGEWARISKQDFRYANPAGVVVQRQEAVTSHVAGAQLRTRTGVNYTLELYHNGTGHSEAEFSDYARLAAQAALDGPESLLMRQAIRLNRGGFGRQQAMRNYLYLRVSTGSYADRGRVLPSIRATANLDDRSHAITPELFYNPYGPWSIRARVTYQGGGTNTEYGEKRTRTRAELRLHYHFGT